ncbi:hypothetical protein ABTY20_34195 [Streptomyces sp. NPDC126497]|uniref:hypothetical protein n=1 Tax=Streptomyces sp. NPDC126497 TaxID=3155313 RepID=UPI00331831D4
MTHAPAASRVLLAVVLSAAALLTAAACVAGDREVPRALPAGVPEPPPASAPTSSASPAAEQPSPGPPALSEGQLRAALITEADLGEPWTAGRGAATWRDGMLKARAQNPDCLRLLDVLYTEEPFGRPAGPSATVTLDDVSEESQLRYQVAAHPPADVDDVLAWAKTLPKECERFEATTVRGDGLLVEVAELPLPGAGDARAGLRVTLTGEESGGTPSRLTVHLAAVRVGEDAITLTNGGPGAVLPEVTRAMARLGADRLADVGRQARVRV